MPNYLLRVVSDFSKPGWIANVNPAVVVLLVVPLTHLARKMQPIMSIGIGLMIIPFSALCVALSPNLGTGRIPIFGLFTLHPVEFMLVIGIALQGIAECFLSPRFLEYASKQAPKGEMGLYMGYSHLTSAFSWFFGSVMGAYLLDKWCPSEKVVAEMPEELRAHAYDHAHYVWYFFCGVGVASFLALLAFKFITGRIDANKEAEESEEA
jgi:MFS family permease